MDRDGHVKEGLLGHTRPFMSHEGLGQSESLEGLGLREIRTICPGRGKDRGRSCRIMWGEVGRVGHAGGVRERS